LRLRRRGLGSARRRARAPSAGGVELDLYLEVAADRPGSEAHRLARQIEREVKVKFPEVSDVVIHIEPATPKSQAQTSSATGAAALTIESGI
jgi:divalent metal cation (Fe/Co/Zn/Cd) transporter